MEDVLEIYSRRYNSKRLVVCTDETNRQLTIESRLSQLPIPGRPAQYDFEYFRNGVNLHVLQAVSWTQWSTTCYP